MSVSVELADLRDRVGEFGTAAFLVTVRDNARPHLVSVVTEWREGSLAMSVGSTSAANATARGDVSLLWPAPGEGGYALIVDGEARVDHRGPEGAEVVVIPQRAVLHRLVGAEGQGPSCITVLSRQQ